jgi:hypothetical protein
MTDTPQSVLKTPPYILRAVHKYNKKNADLINKKAREKYALLTNELKKNKYNNTNNKDKDNTLNTTYTIPEQQQHKSNKYQSLTPEQKEAYKAKQRAYYQLRKLKKLNNNESNASNESNNNSGDILADIPIENLTIQSN